MDTQEGCANIVFAGPVHRGNDIISVNISKSTLLILALLSLILLAAYICFDRGWRFWRHGSVDLHLGCVQCTSDSAYVTLILECEV